MNNFSDRLKELREDSSLSMKQLAEGIGVSDASICKWENGQAEPKASYIIKLSEFFNCSTDYILGKTDDFKYSSITEDEGSFATSQREKKLIENYRKLSPQLKSLTYNTIEHWKKIDI